MAFRCIAISILATLGFFSVPAVYAADCVEARDDYDAWGRMSVSLTLISGSCGSLKIVDRRRDDTRTQVNIYATYPIFDPVRDDAERRYNDWVNSRPAKMNFTGPVEFDGTDVADTMVGTLYRSPRLLSAAIGGWLCCGAHGTSWADSLNIDSRTGRDVRLVDLVKLTDVADHCWAVFSQLDGPMPGQGREFAQAYPPERFAELMQRVVWRVKAEGLVLVFGHLLGYVGAEFDCAIRTAELPRFAKDGVAVPF
jgi:hypothetical protein